MKRLLLLIASACLFAPVEAGATFPGHNGWIVLASCGEVRGCEGDDAELYRVVSSSKGVRTLHKLTDNGAYDRSPAFSADGARLAWECRGTLYYMKRRSDICVMDVDGANKMNLKLDRTPQGDPAWSPDGEWIVYAEGEYPEIDLYKMRSDGTDVMRLTDMASGEVAPAWSSDGSSIIFTHWGDGSETTWIMNADGADQRALTEDVYEHEPDWSPDDRRIVVSRVVKADTPVLESDPGWQLFTMNPDGTDAVQITTGGRGGNHSPTWAPDGRWIIFSRDFNIYKVRPDGTELTRILRDHSREYFEPAWRPR